MKDKERDSQAVCHAKLQEKVRFIGGIAAAFTTVAFLPQAIKVFTKSGVKGLSSWSYGLYAFGCLLWIIYGAKNNMIALCVSCGIGMVFSFVIFCAAFPKEKLIGFFFSQPSDSIPSQPDTALFPETSRSLLGDKY